MAEMTVEQVVQQRVKEIVALLMKRPITEAIAMEVESYDGFEHLEIENGEWVGFDEEEFVSGEDHGWTESVIIHAFTDWVLRNRSGRVYTGDTDFVLDGEPGEIRLKRRPDVGFVSDKNVKRSQGYIYGPPDVAVEIISPTERPGKMRKKLNEYLDNHVKQVWQVFRNSEEIVVHLADGTSKTYKKGDTITGGDLLPGFTLDVTNVFEV